MCARSGGRDKMELQRLYGTQSGSEKTEMETLCMIIFFNFYYWLKTCITNSLRDNTDMQEMQKKFTEFQLKFLFNPYKPSCWQALEEV